MINYEKTNRWKDENANLEILGRIFNYYRCEISGVLEYRNE